MNRLNVVKIAFAACAIGLALAFPAAVLAQSAPAAAAPAASPAPSAAEMAAYVKSLLDNLDPCAGPLELQSKTSVTPCVYVEGEGAFSYGYTSVNIPITAGASGIGPLSGSRSIFGHIDAYPAFTAQAGVGKHAQFSVIAPGNIDTNANANSVSSGATNLQLGYKQMVYKNLQSGTLLSLAGTYEAPTGSAPFAGAGPSYTFQVIAGQALPKHFGLGLELPLAYSVVSTNASGQNQYGLQFSPVVLPYWQSPGGTLLALVISHSFSPNTTPLAFSALQLINRHAQIGVTYGGVNSFTNIAGPIPQVVRFNTAAYPRLLSVNAYFLVGHSDVPQALIDIETAAAKAKAAGAGAPAR